MIWHKNELSTLKTINFCEYPVFESSNFIKNPLINELKDVVVEGTVNYNQQQDIINLTVHISGTMICPCAITLEDVDVDFDIDVDEVYSFLKANEYNAIKIKGDILDITPLVFENIMQEIPIKVVKEGDIVYPKGDGWEITTEKDYATSKDNEIDPRFAVLKDYKFDE